MAKPNKLPHIPSEFYMEDTRAKLDRLPDDGSSIRIGHAYKEDGSECGIGKDDSMVVNHYYGGYYYYCFRCKEQGWVDEYRSPKQVIADAKRQAINAEKKAEAEKSEKFDVPWDCIPANDLDAPNAVAGWLNRYHIDDELIEKYKIQYSALYDRIIFPISEYYIANKNTYGDLVGWCGRCYRPFTKEERIKNHRPKYLTKKDKSKKDRIFWCRFNKDSKYTVIVEDIVSAIRVRESTVHSVIALLTTSIPTNIMALFQDTVIIWLDDDAQGNTFKYVTKMNQVGTKAFFLATTDDPKVFSAGDLKKIIQRRINSANINSVA
jgi:hypothetical protein